MTPILVRPARSVDADALRVLAVLDSAAPLTGDVLLAVSGGDIAAAISLDSGAVIADPFQPTERLRMYLRMRGGAVEAVDREPALRERMLDAVRRPTPVRSMA